MACNDSSNWASVASRNTALMLWNTFPISIFIICSIIYLKTNFIPFSLSNKTNVLKLNFVGCEITQGEPMRRVYKNPGIIFIPDT